VTARAWWLSAFVLGAACGEDPLSIRLDVNKNCNEVEVRRVLSDVGADASALIDAALDPGSDSVWLLVVAGDPSSPRIEVQRVVDGRVQLAVPIEQPPMPGTFSLRSAPDPEQTWVMFRGEGTFRVWRIDPQLAALGIEPVQPSRELASFPHDTFTCVLCDNGHWYRELVFLDGRPYAVSVPPESANASVSVWVGPLVAGPPDTGTLEVGTEHRLEFQKMCPFTDDPLQDEACEASKATISYPSVTVLGRQIDPRPATARLLVHRERAELQVPGTVPDLFVVSLGIDADGIPQGILRSYQDPSQAAVGPPRGIAVDDFASYALYTTQLGGTRLLRLPSPPGELDFEDLSREVDPLDFDTQILQLDADIALGRIENGAWRVTKVFPDALSRSVTTDYEADAPITDVHGIGAGTFLLEKEGRGPEIVRVRCLELPLD
jgi:hypothetical protein